MDVNVDFSYLIYKKKQCKNIALNIGFVYL